MKRVLHKARHPRSKGGGTHDQLLGELVRLPASAAGNNSNSKGSSSSKKGGGSAVLLDTCDGTWLTDLTWDKVRVCCMLMCLLGCRVYCVGVCRFFM